jgi:hypothetical protein
MILTLTLLSLLLGPTMAQFNIQGSPDLKTLRITPMNPGLTQVVKSVFNTKYKPNPHPFMNSYVFPMDFINLKMNSPQKASTQAPSRITSTGSSSPGMVQQTSPASTGLNGSTVRQPVASPYAAPVASSGVPLPQMYSPQPGMGFREFPGISQFPPPADPFSLSEIFQPYLGEALSFGKTFPSFIPSSVPIKAPPVPPPECTIIDKKLIADPKLKDTGPLKSSAPSNSHPTESKKLLSCLTF